MNEADIIEQFRQAMRDQNIPVSGDIIPDGKFHRIHVDGDGKLSKNAFYVLHIDDRPAGSFGCNKRYGNEQKFSWSANTFTPLTPEERRAFAIKMERQKAEREAAQAAARAAAAEEANRIWDAAKECTSHPYLTRKGVASHGLRVGRWELRDRETGELNLISAQALLVPIRDIKKRIHSLQAVFPGKILGGRDKDYLRDGAKEGLFYSIGKPVAGHDGRPVIVIGEGYATMATVHECTGHACIAAFDAGNVKPVAIQIRQRFPDACILIAADNDQWTTTPVNNPGLTAARAAAAAVNGLVAFPDIPANAEGSPTDFNDLFALRGADAVRETISQALAPAPVEPDPVPEPDDEGPPPWDDNGPAVDMAGARVDPPAPVAAVAPPQVPLPPPVPDDDLPENNSHFAILGYNRGTYYIFQFGKRQIMEITKGDISENGLIAIADLAWWEANFPGGRSKIDLGAAAQFIFRTAERRGIYDTSKVRGRGAWTDDGRMVFHHGGYLSVDGDTTGITDIRSKYVYELDKSLPSPADTPMSNEDGRRLLEMAEMFRWTKPGSAALLAGWVALAPMCGALRWRPHIWLTGGAGCGKSTVIDRYTHYLLGGLDLYAQGNSSEAGIRQKLRADALPVLFDESESNEEGDAKRVQNVLSLIRQSSTDSEAQVFKGSAGGAALSFHIRSMFCLASIQVALKHQADVERLAVLALRPKRDDPNAAQTWERLSEALHVMHRDQELPSRLLRRSMELLPITLKNIVVFSHAAAAEFNSQRDGDQYGTLLAGAWSLISDRLATHDDAVEMIRRYDWSEHREQNDSDEGQRALSALMEAHVRVKGGAEVTVYELVCAAFGSPTEMTDLTQATADAILQRHGMKVEGDRLLLSNNSNELRRLMAGTTFEADYRGVLLRVKGADRNDNRPRKFSGVQNKCIGIPLGPIVSGDVRAPAF